MESVTISEFCSELLSEGLRLVTGRGHVLIPCSPHVSRHQHVFVVAKDSILAIHATWSLWLPIQFSTNQSLATQNEI